MNRSLVNPLKNALQITLVSGLHSVARIFTGACLVSLLPSAVLAQQSGEVLIDASPCLKFETSVERLVCFEEQVKAASNAATSAPTGNVNNLPVLSIQRSSASASAPAQVRATPQPQQSTQQQTQTTAPAVANTGPVDRDAAFGLPARVEREEDRDDEEPRDELIGTVAEIRTLNPNQYAVTLTNGQVWHSMQSKYYALERGQTVRIYPTIWGSSYRLTVDDLKGFIQVKRVK